MAEVVEKICLPAKVNIFQVKNAETGELVGVCTEIGKQPEAAPTTPCGLEHPATTCCPWYPPGSTVLECRLEGDQPVAHVVQVAMDPSTATQKMCHLVEARQTPSGPLSRFTSQPQGHSRKPNELLPNDHNQLLEECVKSPITHYLKPLNYPEASITKKLATDCAYLIVSLEPTKDKQDSHGPCSRILYCPATLQTLRASSCDENPRHSPITILNCTTRGPSSRIIERDANPPTKSCFETSVPRAGGHSTAVVSRSPAENSISSQQAVLETRVDECGPRSCNASFPQDHRHYCCCMGSKSSNSAKPHGPSKITCEQGCPRRKVAGKWSRVYRSPPDCASNCPGFKDHQKSYSIDCKDRAPKVERRNGLDPSETVPPSPFKLPPRRQACPFSCCPPTKRPKSQCSPLEHGRRRSGDFAGPESAKCVLARSVSEKSDCGYRGETEKFSGDCGKSKGSTGAEVRESGGPCCEEIAEFFKCYVPRVRSQELVTRYRGHFSPSQLERFEACRSKRNGLQDHCSLPVPRAVLQLKRQELLSRLVDLYKSDRRELDQRRIDACTNRKPTRPPIRWPTPQKPRKKQIKPKPQKLEVKTQRSSMIQARKVRLKRVRSRELYAGVVYTDCDCYHRNGLQHDCPRTSCGGPPCRVKPWPECDLALHFMSKWQKYYDLLDELPPTSFCGPKEAWLAILEEEKRAKEKCHEEQVSEKSEIGPTKKSERIADTVSHCSERPHGIAKEYVMIPIRVEPKVEQRLFK